MIACPIVPRATARATLALFLVGLWMALLFAGHPAGGATHLVLLTALAVFPWRAMRQGACNDTSGPQNH